MTNNINDPRNVLNLKNYGKFHLIIMDHITEILEKKQKKMREIQTIHDQNKCYQINLVYSNYIF